MKEQLRLLFFYETILSKLIFSIKTNIMTNKQQLLKLMVIILIFLLSFIVLIPNVEIWNKFSEGYTSVFHLVLSTINLAFGGYSIYIIGKYLINKTNK